MGSDKSNELRTRAEKIIERDLGNMPELSAEDIRKIVHELNLHQIELEMQNEALQEAQSILKEFFQKYSDLYDSAPVGYFTCDENATLLDANLTLATLLGTDKVRLTGDSFYNFVLSEERDTLYLHLRSIFKNMETQRCELRLVCQGRQECWARLESIGIKDTKSGTTRCRSSVSDISGLKEAEEARRKLEHQLQQAQKLESLGILAGGIAHDFNNLLTGIFGYIELARNTTTDREVASYLDTAWKTITRARALTQQLLTFAKGGAPVRGVDSLVPLIQETARFALSGSNVFCNFDIPPDLWLCDFDKNQIAQVMDNIVINAVQSMPTGGAIVISARNVALKDKSVATLPEGDYVKISIKDTGIGIPSEILLRIFEPFFTTKQKGRGLGLAISYSIIKRHGGCLEVESEWGKGSTFSIYLPASHKSIPDTPVTPVIIHRGSGRVLVMDDENVIRKFFEDILHGFEYSVETRKDGKEALDFFAQECESGRTFACVILDLTVPGGMGGKDAVLKMREVNADIPIFVSSGYADDPVMTDPHKFGFTDSIRKPFTKAQLEEILNKHLKKQ